MYPPDLAWWPETVSWIEAFWLITSVLPFLFVVPAERYCRGAWRELRRRDDAGARRIALTFWLVCLLIGWKAVDNVIVVAPLLFTAPPDEVVVTTAQWYARVISPAALVLNNILLCVMAGSIGHCVRHSVRLRRPPPCPPEDTQPHPMRRASDAQEDQENVQ